MPLPGYNWIRRNIVRALTKHTYPHYAKMLEKDPRREDDILKQFLQGDGVTSAMELWHILASRVFIHQCIFTTLAPEYSEDGYSSKMWRWCIRCGALKLGDRVFYPGVHQKKVIVEG